MSTRNTQPELNCTFSALTRYH